MLSTLIIAGLFLYIEWKNDKFKEETKKEIEKLEARIKNLEQRGRE